MYLTQMAINFGFFQWFVFYSISQSSSWITQFFFQLNPSTVYKKCLNLSFFLAEVLRVLIWDLRHKSVPQVARRATIARTFVHPARGKVVMGLIVRNCLTYDCGTGACAGSPEHPPDGQSAEKRGRTRNPRVMIGSELKVNAGRC